MGQTLQSGVEVSSDAARLDVDAVHAFLSQSYWSPGIPREVLDRALKNSLCFGAYEGSRQVGFARVVTDRATFAWLCDVFVDPAVRGGGLGTFLVGTATAHPDIADLRLVLGTRDAHELYRRFGFASLAAPERWMERR